MVLYLAFYMTEKECSQKIIEEALQKRVMDNEDVYESILYGLSEKQQMVLKAIAFEGKASQIQSAGFVSKYHLTSPSSVQSAVEKLLEKDLITIEKRSYRVDDRFFAIWLRQTMAQ